MGIDIRRVTKTFGSVVAVDNFSLRAEAGELLAVVGPSGCGKTTLLRVVAGLERPDAGRVSIAGNDVSDLATERRDVGFVFQQFALFPNMNVAENVAYGLRRRGVQRLRREQRVADMLEMVGLRGLEHRRPDELSAGQQQRVALARALAPQPKTLLLDEPLSALDAAIRHQLRDELRRTQRRTGITTVMVTHDQEEALAVADRVAVMNEGRLEQVGEPWALYDRPGTEFVARFIGRGNFFTGRRVAGGVDVAGLGFWPADAVAERDGEAKASSPGGATVTVLVRPESVLISPRPTATAVPSASPTVPDETSGASFQLTATVEDVVFGGERAHVRLQPVAHLGGKPSQPPATIIAAVSGADVRDVVDNKHAATPVTVTIPFRRLRLLPR